MRCIAVVAALLGVLAVLGPADARGPYGSISVGNWMGGAFTSDRIGEFSHCGATAIYQSGIIFVVMIDSVPSWSLGFAHDGWSLSAGQPFPIALTFDGGTVTDGLLVGTQGGYRLARRDASGTWTSLLPGITGTDLYGVAAIDDHEFLAVGNSMSGPPFLRFADGGLSALQPAPPLILSADAIWVSSPNEVFVIGQTSSGQRTLYRGVR